MREHFEAFYGEVSWICIRRHFFKQHHQDGFGFVSFTEKKIEDELKTFSVLQREKVVYHFTTAKEVDAINQTRRFDLQKRSGMHEYIFHNLNAISLKDFLSFQSLQELVQHHTWNHPPIFSQQIQLFILYVAINQ